MFGKRAKNKVTLRKYRAVFNTIDGNTHKSPIYNWMIMDRVSSASEYLMIKIKYYGYI